MLNFVYLLPFIGGAGSAGKKILNIRDELSYFFKNIYLVLIILGVLFLFYLMIKFVILIYKNRCRKIKELLTCLYSTCLFLEEKNIDKDVKVKFDFTKKELILKISQLISSRFIKNKLGEHCYKLIIQGIKFISEDKIDIESQKDLINNWIQFFS